MIILLGLYAFFVAIVIIVVVQFVLSFIIMNRLKRLQEKVNNLMSEKKEPKVVSTVAPFIAETPKDEIPTKPQIAVVEKPIEVTQKTNESSKTNKEKVLEAIQEIKEVQEQDLPHICRELSAYFAKYTNEDYTKDLSSKSYFRFIDLSSQTDTRVVTIGDIHSDYNSLAAILLKLTVSDYNYFDNAIFIFLGDYLDRGSVLFEPLMLLKSLKEILGERMIMLKGNHESVRYDSSKQQLVTSVTPNQSCQCLNEYCGKDKVFLQQFAVFYSLLPIYVFLKTKEKNILLTHAAIPRDASLESVHFDENSGALMFDTSIPVTNRLQMRNVICKDMIWGDPKNCDRKMQVEGRFEFGRLQFNNFTLHNHINLLFRSHEESTCGYKSIFDDRVFTIFSTGGSDNDQTGYPSVEPAFAIIQNERFVIENSYVYRLQKDGQQVVLNLFNKQKYTEKQQEGLKLGGEFECDQEQIDNIRSVFKHIKASFYSDTNTDN